MKTNTNKTENSKVTFKSSSRLTKCVSIFLALAVLNLSMSCSYYSIRDVPATAEVIAEEVENFNASEKYVIVHSESNSWHLKDMMLNEDKQLISGTITPLNEAHSYKKIRDSRRVHRYKIKEQDPLDEIHFYLKTPTSFQLNKNVNITLNDIEKISYNDKNTGRTVANIFVGTIGTAFAVLLIAAALKSSCPFVYIKDGNAYRFTGELYPGIITPNLQRNDYLALPDFSSNDGFYTLKVANKLKEIQYTDQLQLLSVSHPQGIEVLMDSKGHFQTFKNIASPTKVMSNNDTDNLDLALRKDTNYYTFNAPQSTPNSTRRIIFQFDKPQQAQDAKLYLTAKNSMWLDYAYGKFNQQFGSYYNTFQEKQQKVDKVALHKWTNEQHIPLSVYVKTTKGWQLVERIHTVGPLATRDIAVPIDLSTIKETVLQIKLETGFMFWEVDYVGIDYSKNVKLDVTKIDPVSALDKYGKDVTDLLVYNDENYFIQPKIGDELTVKFPAIATTDTLSKTSIFLKNRGYYNYIRDYDGTPDAEKLKTFRDANAFTKFSENAYFDFINYSINNLAHNG